MRGRTPGKVPLLHQLSVRLTAEEYAVLGRLAEAEERTIADVARRVFRLGLPLYVEQARTRGVVIPEGDGAEQS